MKWAQTVVHAVLALMGFMALIIVNDMRGSIKEMGRSVESLNSNVARIIERTEWHGKALEAHERRLDRLEGVN